MNLYKSVFDRTYTLSLVRLARRYGALNAFSVSKLFPSVEDNRNGTYCEDTGKWHIFTTQKAILASIKVSANIASPEGMRPEWTVCPGMSSPPPAPSMVRSTHKTCNGAWNERQSFKNSTESRHKRQKHSFARSPSGKQWQALCTSAGIVCRLRMRKTAKRYTRHLLLLLFHRAFLFT